MLIRSQDRKILLNLDNVSAFTLDGPGAADDELHSEKTVTAYMTDTSAYFIGTYSTEEKALEVLDMISYVYSNRGTCDYANNHMIDGISQYPVFQMPEDTEGKDDSANPDPTL